MPAHQVEGRLGGPLDRGHRDLVVRARAGPYARGGLTFLSCVMRCILMIYGVSRVLLSWYKTQDARVCAWSNVQVGDLFVA